MAISNNSTGLRPGVCTSTTRPTAPYEGQHIYETDTDIEYVWNGSAWVVNYVSAASPTFTGVPTAPTAAAGTNTTQLATTAFANTAGGLVFIKSQVIGSGVSSVQVTDAFNTNYDNYKIVVSGGASSQQTSIYMILGASTSTYYGVYLYANYSTGTPQGAAINNQANFIYAGGADIAVLNVNIELQNPFLAKYTNIQALTVNYASIRGSAYGEHETASSYTSFTLAPYAGTLTGGTISVYGYRK